MVDFMLLTGMTPLCGFITGLEIPGGIGFLLYLWVNVWATLRAINYTRGAATPAWLAFIWLIPCLGGVLTLVGVKKTELPPPPPTAGSLH